MARNHSEYQVYFHVGLGKAASTYLQHRVFPILQNIRYIPRDRYRGYQGLIERTQDTRYLVSREAAYRLQQRVDEFAAFKPDARVILVLRRHDRWIASHYRRYLKNGGSLDFEHYLDLDSNQPRIWGAQQVRFMAMIEAIEQRFSSRPLVLFHEDLQADPFALIDQLCAFTGAHYQREQVNLSIVHRSWSDKQLKLTRLAGKRLFDPVPRAATNPTLHRVRRRLHLWACYGILGVAQMVPSRWVNPDPLINPESLSRVREVFANDWLSCHDYAQAYNPPVSGIRPEADQTL